MKGGKQLLLLAVFTLLKRCQQTPQVSMSPDLKKIFSGDVFYLSCDSIASGHSVTWYLNETDQMIQNKTLKVAAASPMHSGSYHCESNGEKSASISIEVLGYVPSASLTILTGQPVVQPGGSVILQLDNDDGLDGWICWLYKGGNLRRIKLRLKEGSVSFSFQYRNLTASENIFWCTNEPLRSNQITIRTSDNQVSLEMYPLPAVSGDSLTLTCFTWGTHQITHAVFYRNGVVIQNGTKPTHNIGRVTESEKGIYRCAATFTYRGRTKGPPYHVVSDDQDVLVLAPPMRAVLSANAGMTCSCPLCPSGATYKWYHKDDDSQQWKLLESEQTFMMPRLSGTYACRAAWGEKRTLLSRSHIYHPPITSILIGVVIVLLILGVACVAFYLFYKRRNATGQIYEDMPMRSQDKGDDKYETLRGAQKGGEYDTLHPEAAAGRERKEGEYEPLNKEGMKDAVYQTVGVEGAAGGSGGYEALKKQGMKDGVYHTLGSEGAAEGAGGYEALKKQGMKDGVYHTLGSEGAAEGAGGYEALKKEGMKEGLYHTLGVEGAGGAEGGQEAVGKKDKDKEYEEVEEKK